MNGAGPRSTSGVETRASSSSGPDRLAPRCATPSFGAGFGSVARPDVDAARPSTGREAGLEGDDPPEPGEAPDRRTAADAVEQEPAARGPVVDRQQRSRQRRPRPRDVRSEPAEAARRERASEVVPAGVLDHDDRSTLDRLDRRQQVRCRGIRGYDDIGGGIGAGLDDRRCDVAERRIERSITADEHDPPEAWASRDQEAPVHAPESDIRGDAAGHPGLAPSIASSARAWTGWPRGVRRRSPRPRRPSAAR